MTRTMPDAIDEAPRGDGPAVRATRAEIQRARRVTTRTTRRRRRRHVVEWVAVALGVAAFGYLRSPIVPAVLVGVVAFALIAWPTKPKRQDKSESKGEAQDATVGTVPTRLPLGVEPAAGLAAPTKSDGNAREPARSTPMAVTPAVAWPVPASDPAPVIPASVARQVPALDPATLAVGLRPARQVPALDPATLAVGLEVTELPVHAPVPEQASATTAPSPTNSYQKRRFQLLANPKQPDAFLGMMDASEPEPTPVMLTPDSSWEHSAWTDGPTAS